MMGLNLDHRNGIICGPCNFIVCSHAPVAQGKLNLNQKSQQLKDADIEMIDHQAYARLVVGLICYFHFHFPHTDLFKNVTLRNSE